MKPRVLQRSSLLLLLLAMLVGGLGPATQAEPSRAQSDRSPATDHPRLWITTEDLPRLRSWAVDGNPFYRDGLAVLAETARADMDAGRVPAEDNGGPTYVDYPTENYAELFAFMSLICPDKATRDDYAGRARALLMYAMTEAVKGPAEDQPFRHPDFAISDRSRWHGEAWALTVDWIYPSLSQEDKATIRQVFLRWAEDNRLAETTSHNHPEPIGFINDPVLVQDRVLVRYAANNYYTAHMRNLGLMAMALDPVDDPGGELASYLENATGAWLYVIDHLLRTDARGGLAPEGFEYSPQAIGYVAQFLVALHTAGQDDPAVWGPQVSIDGNPFWADMVTAYLHLLSPVPVIDPDYGEVYQPAWYGDGQTYRAPDYIAAFGALGLFAQSIGDATQLEALRWIQLNMAPGGAATLLSDRVARANDAYAAILYFTLFDPAAPPPRDPRPALPTTFYAPGIGRLLARTDWGPNASWFTYSLGWNTVDHQHADGNQFEFYRDGEWLTKERTGYGTNIGSSDYHNTLALENDPPDHNEPGDYRRILWERGSQWLYSPSGDGRILAISIGSGFVYALGDATALYNTEYDLATDITHASRSIVWLESDDVVIYDRASSKTEGRFKRFWLNLPAEAAIDGNRSTMTTATGQQLVVTTLLPANAAIASEPAELLEEDQEPANNEPMQFRLRVEAPGSPADVRFLNVLQGLDAEVVPDTVTIIAGSGGTAFVGALVDETVVFFPANLSEPFAGLVYIVPASTTRHLVTGLMPDAGYDIVTRMVGNELEVTIAPGTATQADAGGVLVLGPGGEQAQPDGAPPAPTPIRIAAPTPSSAEGAPTPFALANSAESGTPSASEQIEPSVEQPGVLPASGLGDVPAGTGVITYRQSEGHVYRITATSGAVPEDVSEALNVLSPAAPDYSLNVSPDGDWLVLETERFDPGCAGWACLAIVHGDLTSGEAVRASGELVRLEGIAAVADGGNMIVFTAGDGPHPRDLWAVTRAGPASAWDGPRLLTADSPFAYNTQAAISPDGTVLVFDCSDEPYGAPGRAICEVGTDGAGFRIVLTPDESPPGVAAGGALHQPDYAPDGSIVFEAEWNREQIWLLQPDTAEPVPLATTFFNDNSPCVLPDGRIVSLWLDREGGLGLHELKVMTADGRDYGVLLPGVDVADIGIGCGG